MNELKQVDVLRVYASGLDCPHCDAQQEGWLIDPRGTEQECDECNGRYLVPIDVRLRF